MKKKRNITLNSYNKTADEYFKNVTQFEILPELDTFCNLIKPNGNILDLGCGPGHHSKIFAEKGFKVTGVDYSPTMIKMAKKSTSLAKFQVMDIKKITFKDNSFDSIWASASLIHIEKSIFPKVLHRVKEILKDNGILYLSLKEGIGEEETIDKRYGDVVKFHAFYEEEEIEKYLLKDGFRLLDIYIRAKRSSYDTNNWIHVFVRKS